MKIFLDTADVPQIREAWDWGVIDGVATNPSHIAKTGRIPAEIYREICGYPTHIIVAAVRHPTHVLEAALAGVDICTMSLDVLKQFYQHPLTETVIEVFLNDWKKVPKP